MPGPIGLVFSAEQYTDACLELFKDEELLSDVSPRSGVWPSCSGEKSGAALRMQLCRPVYAISGVHGKLYCYINWLFITGGCDVFVSLHRVRNGQQLDFIFRT